jgi:hypothetical protein
MSKPSARLEIGKSSSPENAALPASTVTPAVVASGRMQDRRSLRSFGVAEDEL